MWRTLLIVLAMMAAFMFLRSPYFAILEAEVVGTETVTPDEIIALSGLSAPVLIWDVEPAAVAARVRAHPRVLGASVKRIWPNRLRIEVMERSPLVAIKTDAGWITVDAEGVALERVKEKPDMLQLIAFDLPPLSPGDTLPSELQPALEMAGYVRQYGLTWIEAIDVSAADIVLWLSGDIPAYLGPTIDQPERKLAVLQALWTSWQNDLERVRYFDVENVRHPAVQTDPNTDDDA